MDFSLSEMSYKDILNFFTDDEIYWSVYRDEFYRDILSDLIRSSIKDMDKEEQVLFNDINDNRILLEAHRDIFGTSETIALLLDNGYLTDLAQITAENYGGNIHD